ncbi:MAG TPA: GAF domain-containing sensor histidine kinase [Anaerolineales bacterium]|nr:GAF domain-containing sensor histidine kinase [Anaerolineales bacterium]
MTDLEIERRLERYQRVIAISNELALTLDLDRLLNQVVHAAAELCDAQAASILLYDEVKSVLNFSAASNLSEPMMRGLVVPVASSIAGWIVTHKEPVIIDNADEDPRHFGGVALATNITTTSMLGVPMLAKGKVIGALEAINKLSGKFTEEDQELLMVLGVQTAIAIENARLFHQSDLISELVHELRTPLTSLSTAARLLLRPNLSPEMRTQVTEIITAETDRLTEMTTAFLDLARLESGRATFDIEPFDIQLLISECVSQMRAKAEEDKNLCIELILPGNEQGLPDLVADRDKVKQVLLNLLSNAIKYNSPCGEITVRASQVRDNLEIRVQDTGPGIPPESLPHMFEKFFRVPGIEKSIQGTGLGLYICKRIMDAHHGSIDIVSQPGKGSTFILTFPIGLTGTPDA